MMGKFRSFVVVGLMAVVAVTGCKKKAPDPAAPSPVSSPAPAAAPAPAPVALLPAPPLGKNLAALPLLANANTPALQQINASLTSLNKDTKSDAAQCGAGGDFEQTVTPTMLGPGYVSFYVGGSMDCGGAHPDVASSVLLFDLSTGKAVDWTQLVHAPGVQNNSDTGADGKNGAPQALIYPALLKLYLADPDNAGDCQTSYNDPQSFILWPEAKSATLIVEAFDLPHVVQACANDMKLTLDQAKALGFDQGFLNAVMAAHNQPGAAALTSTP